MVLAFQLLNTDEQKILKKQIEEIEQMVLEDDVLFNVYKCNDCKYKWKTKTDWFDIQGCPKCRGMNIVSLQERQSLFDIEMACESNRDYNAFFLRYGDRVDKFSIERRLIKIKQWVFMIIRERAGSRRFKRFR
jgi:predicted Zn-ribbon and HTH transcriptional regulator